MRRTLLIIFMFCSSVAIAGDRLPIPDSPVNYNPRDIIRDPGNGDSIVSNQILLAFKENVTKARQKAILARVNATVIGGMPDIDVYQIAFDNPRKSFAIFNDVYDVLRLQDDVLFVMPRKVQSAATNQTDYTFTSYKRAGGLALDPVSRKTGSNATDTYEGAVSAHQSGLFACIERRSRLFKQFHGRVEFELMIDNSGDVQYAKIVSSSFKDRRLLRCLVSKVRKWKNFPQHSADSNVSMRFTFEF